MAAMTSKFYYVCVIQYYSDQWLKYVTVDDAIRSLVDLGPLIDLI